MSKATNAELQEKLAAALAHNEALMKSLEQAAKVSIKPPKTGVSWHVYMSGVKAWSVEKQKYYSPSLRMPREVIEYLSKPETCKHFQDAIAAHNDKQAKA